MAPTGKPPPDRHLLYEAAVQNVDTDIAFAERCYRRLHKTHPTSLREDFCGTAKLASRWVERRPNHQAWGIDLHKPTLEWGLRHHGAALTPPQRERLHLLCGNVLDAETPPTDLTMALNFSFCVFKHRDTIGRYFAHAQNSLNPGGLLILDLYGGSEALSVKCDPPRIIPGFTQPDGLRVPDFEYIWEQAVCNPLTHETRCHIHFKVPGHRPLQRAFTYDWRLWTVPELRELLFEAGFSAVEIYIHGFTDDGASDEIFRRRTTYENCEGWIAYIVGIKA